MRRNLTRCAIVLAMVFSMVFSPWAIGSTQMTQVFANEKNAETIMVKVNGQYQQEFLATGEDVEVYPGLAEEYGYSNAETVTEGTITALDALVAVHVKKYGDAVKDYLKMNNYGNPVEIFGNKNTAEFSGFAINHSYPKDENNQGYSVYNAPIANGDVLDFFYYEDEYYGDYLTWFADESGKIAEELTVEKGTENTLYLNGFMYMSGYADPESEPVFNSENGLTAYKTDENGKIADSIGDITEEDGKVVFKADEAGTFYLTAQGYNDDGFLVIMPLCKVTVTDGEEEPEPGDPGEEPKPEDPGTEEPGEPVEYEPEDGEGAPLTEVPAQWKNFRNSDANMAVVSSPLAKSEEEAKLKWKAIGSSLSNWGFYYPSTYIIVNDKIVATGGDQLILIDQKTGKVEKQVTMYGNREYSYMPPVYGGGMIYVAMNKGIIQAFDAVTLESKWIYEDAVGGQSLSNIAYKDGIIYTGFTSVDPSKENNFVAIDVRDKAPEKQDERKRPLWTYAHQGGFYWSGAVVLDKYVVVGGENSTILVLDKETGKVADSAKTDGDIRSSMAEKDGKLYCVTKGGTFYELTINSASGKIDKLTSVAKLEAGSTSTPVIVKEKAYIGLANKTVAQIDMKTGQIQTVDVPASTQSSLLANTYYEGKTYLYFVCNNNPGSLDVIEVDDATGTMKYSTIYTPEEALQNYSIASVMCNQDGTLYYANDSGHIFAVENTAKIVEEDPKEDDPGQEPGKPEEGKPSGGGQGEDAKPVEQTTDKTPATGDETTPLTWVILLGLAAAGIYAARLSKEHNRG